MELIKHNEIEEKIIILRDTPVILDSDVAAIYNVETMRINEAVKNNPDKFPKGYIIELNKEEKGRLSKISITLKLNSLRHCPKPSQKKVCTCSLLF